MIVIIYHINHFLLTFRTLSYPLSSSVTFHDITKSSIALMVLKASAVVRSLIFPLCFHSLNIIFFFKCIMFLYKISSCANVIFFSVFISQLKCCRSFKNCLMLVTHCRNSHLNTIKLPYIKKKKSGYSWILLLLLLLQKGQTRKGVLIQFQGYSIFRVYVCWFGNAWWISA